MSLPYPLNMARCVFICTYVLVTLLVACKSSAKILQRDVCLDPVLLFVTAHSSCKEFYEHDVNDSFQKGTASTCHATCQIKLDYWDKTWNNLKFVSLEFEGYNYSTEKCCSSANTARLYINCSRWRKEQLRIIWSNNCSESHADCFKWFGLCICHCEPGYLMIDGGCLQIKSSTTNIGPILGALLGGLLIGVVITAGFGFVTYKRFRSNVEQRKEPLVLFSMNDTYGRTKNDDILPEEPHVHQHEQERVVNVYPLTGSEDLPEYGNIAKKKTKCNESHR